MVIREKRVDGKVPLIIISFKFKTMDKAALTELIDILEKDYPDVKLIDNVGDSTWGRLVLPGTDETSDESSDPLKLVLICSYIQGHMVLDTVKAMADMNPGRIEIKGVVTDDPVDPNAKISVKRRIWRKYGEEETIYLENSIIESAIDASIPVYTGSVKTRYFHDLLGSWSPDAIIVCVFGQIIDSFVIDYPGMGIYNIHPADLKAGFGAGPQPFQDLINRNASTSRITIHQLSEELDSGHILGQSSPINIRYKDGSLPDDILILQDKILEPTVPMVYELVKTLVLKKSEGFTGKISHLDFSKHFTRELKQNLMKPIGEQKPKKDLPVIRATDLLKI